MGISYTKQTGGTYRAYFYGVACYVKRLAAGAWVADFNEDELDDDLTSYRTREKAARACILRRLKRK